jgi:CubicO group peptidase (beta-lactamase class C family)
VQERQVKLRPGTPKEAGMAPARVRHLVNLGTQWVDQGIAPALVLIAARHGVIVLHEAFGRVAPEAEAEPTRLNTIFPMSSISKVVTATCIMLLVEDGLVGLNRPVHQYVPDMFVGADKAAVTLHHLLTHTSGWEEKVVEAHALNKKGTIPIPPHDGTQHPVIQEQLFLRRDAPLSRPPGTLMSYCSPGYDLVGEIVRRVSGHSLEVFARERLFEPLDMQDSFFVAPEEALSRVVRRRPLDPAPFGLDDSEYHRTPWPESGMLSTALDMATFAQTFLNGGTYGHRRLLSIATVAAMTRDQIPGISGEFLEERFPVAGWSYGWGLRADKHAEYESTLSSEESFEHVGSGGVFLWGDPVHDIVGAYFSVARSSPLLNNPYHTDWAPDLFVNAVTAAIDE